MNVLNNPITNIQFVINHFKEKEESIAYVCTTELPEFPNRPIDIFYRYDGPHPTFSNTYLGLFINKYNRLSICNADSVTTLYFSLVNTPTGYIYSSYRHDFVEQDGTFIDGGRSYTRTNSSPIVAKVEHEKFIQILDNEYLNKTIDNE